MTPDEALAFFLDMNLTKHKYILLRKTSKKQKALIYPTYEELVAAKKACYPSNINVTEIGCSIPVQDSVDHIARRIAKIPTVYFNPETSYEMIYKYGGDGSSNQALYKQRFLTAERSESEGRFVNFEMTISTVLF